MYTAMHAGSRAARTPGPTCKHSHPSLPDRGSGSGWRPGFEVRLGGAGRPSGLNTWLPGTGEAAKTGWVWSRGGGRGGVDWGSGCGAGAEVRGKREWSASPSHEAGASEDNKGGWQGAGRGVRGGGREPSGRVGGGVGKRQAGV